MHSKPNEKATLCASTRRHRYALPVVGTCRVRMCVFVYVLCPLVKEACEREVTKQAASKQTRISLRQAQNCNVAVLAPRRKAANERNIAH